MGWLKILTPHNGGNVRTRRWGCMDPSQGGHGAAGAVGAVGICRSYATPTAIHVDSQSIWRFSEPEICLSPYFQTAGHSDSQWLAGHFPFVLPHALGPVSMVVVSDFGQNFFIPLWCESALAVSNSIGPVSMVVVSKNRTFYLTNKMCMVYCEQRNTSGRKTHESSWNIRVCAKEYSVIAQI